MVKVSVGAAAAGPQVRLTPAGVADRVSSASGDVTL
jgi:hypothetical protein